MSNPRLSDEQLERILEDWMTGTPERVPEHVLDSAFAETRATKQTHRWWRRLGRGGADGSGGGRWPALVLVGVVIGGLGVVATGALLRDPSVTDPGPTTTPAPSDVAVVPADTAALTRTWIGIPDRDPADPDGNQAWVLRMGSFATLQGPAGEIQVLAGFTADGTEVTFPTGTGACLGVPATYTWSVDGERLTLRAKEDPCADRRAPLETYAWQLVPDGWFIASRFRAPFAAPSDSLALVEITTTLHAFGGNAVEGGSGLAVWIVEDVVQDPCPLAGGLPGVTPLDPGAEGLIRGLQAMPNVEVTAPEPATAAGLPATHVKVRVTGESCEVVGTARLWEDRGPGVGEGVGSEGQYLESFRGGEADLYIVDVDGITVTLVAFSRQVEDFGPAMDGERRELIERVRFFAPSP